MPRSLISSLESGSYNSASPASFERLMVRKYGKQPARVPYSPPHNSSQDSEDSQEFTGTSSDLSSPPMPSSKLSPALSVTTSGEPASGSRHPHPSRDEGASTTAHARYDDENYPETSSILTPSIPADELPDDIIVHDAHDLPYPVRYVRVTPLAKGPRQYAVPARDPAETSPLRRVAQVHLANDNHISTSNAHSTVFRAPLALPVAAGSEVATRVRVVAKTPAPACGSHRQLHQEARMYHAFPRELAERSTRNRLDGSLQQCEVRRSQQSPRPVTGSAGPEGCSPGVQKRKTSWREQLSKFKRKPKKSEVEKRLEVEARAAKPLLPRDADQVPLGPLKSLDVPPVVPKFFGYYLLLKPDGRVFFELSEAHGECGEDGTCGVAWPPAILLIEDCGDPIQPWLFADAQRWGCYHLLDGLHDAGFVAGQHAPTAWTEKMLVQPGPLAAPREVRSYATPSFRLVDFGRSRCRQAGFEEHWQKWCDQDLDGAFDALQLDHRR
ncbi:hypothetical protein LXA43DRAFT_1073628 [Ganoderma leucocontextum]|nr:hypothetical protein LXA43DRAFT_1073628 [Ganoderma leucocontextum]